MIPQSAELELAAAAPLTWLLLICGNGRWRERRRRDVQKATSAMVGGAGVRQRRGKNEEECERRTGAAEKNRGVLLSLILSYRGNTGPYENTTPAGGPSYAPDVEKGKGEGEAE